MPRTTLSRAWVWVSPLERQPQKRAASARPGAILERQRAAVRLRDLAAEHQADPGAARLRGEERDEEIRRVRQPRALVVDPQLELPVAGLPRDRHAAARFEGRVHGVVHEI